MIDPALSNAIERAAGLPTLLVAADYDGTLSPIVDDPARAVPHRPALDALTHLGARSGVHAVIISGRSLEALARLTDHPRGVVLIGTHGAESAASDNDDDAASASTVVAVVDALESVAAGHPGTLVEPKPVGAAFHFRNAVDPDRAEAAALAAAAPFDVRVIRGKMVVELVAGDAHKGSAIADLRGRVGADAVVFIGDDTTDEDVFVTLGDADVGIKVGPGSTAARYRVSDPAAVAAVLEGIDRARATAFP